MQNRKKQRDERPIESFFGSTQNRIATWRFGVAGAADAIGAFGFEECKLDFKRVERFVAAEIAVMAIE